MSIPKFRNHPIIKEFNGLKKFFRVYENEISKQRILDFKNFATMIYESGDSIAFDLLGSVNFGQPGQRSDTDVVIYLNCNEKHPGDCDMSNCRRLNLYKNLLINTIIYRYASDSYPIQIVDCINLQQLEKDIQNNNSNSFSLVKFGFYRAICRGINRKLLRKFENQLSENDDLCKTVEESLTDCFLGMIHSSQHSYSFRKYIERLEDSHNLKIPSSMAEKINRYLNF